MKKPEPNLNIWNRSGTPRTVRIDGYGVIAPDGTLQIGSSDGVPYFSTVKARAKGFSVSGTKVIRIIAMFKVQE